MTGKTLDWGIVGCGDVVFKKSGPSILATGASRIVAVMRRDAAQARPFADAHGIPVCTDDADQVIGSKEVDIVYVATPPVFHRDYVLAAAAAGKHVLVEKPMGLSEAQDDEMIEACDAAGVELFVAYYRRFHPHVAQMKALVEQGAIGRPVLAQVDFAQPATPASASGWRVQPEVSGGGLLVDVVSHRIDLLCYLLGRPVAALGMGGRSVPALPVDDATVLAIRMESGAVCGVAGDFASSRFSDRFVIAGTAGTIESERLDGHAFTVRRSKSVEEFRFDPYPAPHLGLIRHIEDVLGGRAANVSSGRDGRLTDAILDQAVREVGPGTGLKSAAPTPRACTPRSAS